LSSGTGPAEARSTREIILNGQEVRRDTWGANVSDNTDVFAERLLQRIDEGRRTATYKLALLLALIDSCAAGADNT
jgi:hypothetical protein